MGRKALLLVILAVLTVVVAVPALALAWTWQEYSGFPPEVDETVTQLDVHGTKGIMICDGNEFMLSNDGGASWAPLVGPLGQPWHLPAMGMMDPLSCARRGDRVLLGGKGFVAVYNTDTGDMTVERMTGESTPPGGGFVITQAGKSTWGIRAVDIRKGPNDNEMLAVGYDETEDGGLEALILETSDHGGAWTPADTGLDWPHLNGVICQRVSYAVGPDYFLAEKNPDSSAPGWSRTKYPGFETLEITGWDGRQNTVWMAREDGSVIKRTGDGDWEVFEVNPAIERMKVAFRSQSDGIAIGNDRQGHGHAYHSTDGGETWELDTAPLTAWYTGWVEPSGNNNVKFLSMVHTRDARDNVTDHPFYRPGLVFAPVRPVIRRRP